MSADRPLVAGELRGYRQFDLLDGGLVPPVQVGERPWDGVLERARCAKGLDHVPPDPDCTCGLYAMYRPGSATVSLGYANAVVAARGRTVLGDRGFRAARARVEAVALPLAVQCSPGAVRRARAQLAQRYPSTRVYRSTRRMLHDHPPHDLRALGLDPPADRSRGYRAVAVVVWAAFVLAGYGLVFLPRETVAAAFATWWPLLLAGFVAWQAALVWLVTRLMALQMPGRDASQPPDGADPAA